MNARTWRRTGLAVALALSAAACGGGSSSSASPTAPSTTTTTETYSGTLGIGALVIHAFPITGSGTVRIVITELSPASTAQVGLGFGVWDGVNCALALTTNAAKVNQLFEASVGVAANYCVSLADANNLTETTTYTVRVEHP